jgi:hypothetical protein
MSKRIEIAGKFFKTMREAAAAHGISDSLWSSRVRRGWDPPRAVTQPVQKAKLYTVNGITAPRALHAARLGIDPQTISKRLLRGFSMRAALTQLPPRVSMRAKRAGRAARNLEAGKRRPPVD